METTAETRKILNVGSEDLGVTIWDSRSIAQVRRTPAGINISNIIDTLGSRSAKAQGLPRVISSSSFLASSDHKMYLVGSGGLVYGMLKIGVKKLFIRGKYAEFHEISPTCVLDFYVSETHQRTGVGHFLFEKMLDDIGQTPRKLGYDRPSPKLLSFLAKHYQLTEYVQQNNNYVVFDNFWDTSETTGAAAKSQPCDGTPPPPQRAGGSLAATPPSVGYNSYNIINMQQSREGSIPMKTTPVQRTGKRLVRPPYA